jgi:hypothetical protein
MRILIVIGLLCFAGLSFGQAPFFHMYANGGDDNAEGAAQLEDSSFIITGSSDSYPGSVGSQAFLMKLDTMGVPVWSKHYGGNEMDQGKRVAYVEGVGYYVSGTTNSIGSGAYDFYLFKTDLNGDMLWEKAYGGSSWERLHDAALTRDTGMLMVGETLSNPTNNPDMYMVRTDKDGDTLWTKSFGGSGEDVLSGIIRYDDSTFYVAGNTYIEDSAYTKAYIAKFHEDGTMLWSDTIGPNGNYFINDVSATDLDVFCAGYRNGPGVDGNDLYYMRHQHDGTHLGETTHAAEGDYKAHEVTAYGVPDKRYVGYTVFSSTSQQDGDDLYIIRTNYVFYWDALTPLHLYYLQPEKINEIIPTIDGGALAVGQMSGEAMGLHHAYVYKIGANDSVADYNPPHTVYSLVGIDEQEIDDNLSIYPNPTTGMIHIESSLNEFVQVEILNSLGQVLEVDSFQGNYSFDLSQYGSGMYLLRTSVDGVSHVRKVMVN